MRIRSRKRVYIPIILYLLLILMQGMVTAPVLLWNRTPSVPLGIYRRLFRIPQYKETMIKDKMLTLYVAIDAKVLLQEFPTLPIAKRYFLQQHGELLSRKNILLMKQLSLPDVQYVMTHAILPEKVSVVAHDPQGIDSTYIGPVPSLYIRGIYEFIGN